jgi:hypothetical protein
MTFAPMADAPVAIREVDIHEVDLVQTDAGKDDQGTLYVNLTVDGHDVVRVYRHFPVSLYEEWLDSDFGADLYLAEIEPVFPRVEEREE